jgi:hypothetical protein
MKPQNQFKIILILLMIFLISGCTKSNLNSTKEITSEECNLLNGRIINTLNKLDASCDKKDIIANINDLECPCVCCKNLDNDFKLTYALSESWIGTYKIITIKNDGSVIIENLQPLQGNSTTTKGHISNEELEELKNIVNNANVFNLEDIYICEENCMTDSSGSFIGFMIDGNEKNITINYQFELLDIPESLNQVLKNVQEIENNLS